ncbi:MAG: TonB-dependent receptor, partial [Sphingobacteriales bacterium]
NEGSGLVSPVWTVYTAPLTYNLKPALDENGNQRIFRYSRNNPYWVLDNVHNTAKLNRFIPVLTVTYNPFKWATITERVGADVYAEQTQYTEAPSTMLNTNGEVNDVSANFRQFNHDLIVDIRPNLGSNWNLSMLIGNNVFSTFSQNNSITGTGTTIPGFNNISNGATITATSTFSQRRKVGFYAQSNLEYKRLLNLSLTGRYDGTSVLGTGNNYYPYGSASLAFMFSELLKVPALNFGKLRVSYSSVGNDNVGAYSLATPYNRPGGFPYDGRAGFLLSSSAGNSDLKDERTNELEVGLELKFLRNRIGIEASYFDRMHKDLLTNINISTATGFSSTTVNAGDMTNKGVEFNLNTSPIR